MDRIRIKNIRSIIDSGDIELNSINILLGRNSSGKSSFLRLFPMLKESARNELRGPILWFDETYDFGSYANTFSRHAKSERETMTLCFTWKPAKTKSNGRLFYPSRLFSDSTIEDAENVSVILSIGKAGDEVVLKKMELQIDSMSITIVRLDNSPNLQVRINDCIINTFTFVWNYGTSTLLPSLQIVGKVFAYEVLDNALKKIYVEKGLDISPLLFFPKTIFNTENEIWNEIESKIVKSTPKKARTIRIEGNEADRKKVVDAVFIMTIQSLLQDVDDYLTKYFRHTYYITPLRYNFQRYMRNRDLSVDYIDSSGKNVMEYILSLNKSEKDSYVKYLKKTLKIEVDVEGKENKSIFIKTEDGEKDNIVDVGYGFSQVLPIATTLWDRAYKKIKDEVENTIVIEQPEVHLHPAMQKRLAVLFVEALNIAKLRGKALKLIVETHSQHLVNHLGKYVANSYPPRIKELLNYYLTDVDEEVKITPEEISIYLFEKKDGVTSIAKTGYDKRGQIQRWPIGFLD